MIKKFFLLLLMGVTTFLFAQTIAPKKCNTCGMPLAQCQYKGRHPKPTSGKENAHEWVDLGLPSGTKWATMTVGAKKESDRGNHFAWCETKIKSNYSWETYFDKLGLKPHERVPSSLVPTGFVKYSNNGQKEILPESGHDVARVRWGGLWEMASAHDYQELLDNCNWEKVAVNGRKGFRAISKVNNKSIFFPATGDKIADSGSYAISGGFYWTLMIRIYESII